MYERSMVVSRFIDASNISVTEPTQIDPNAAHVFVTGLAVEIVRRRGSYPNRVERVRLVLLTGA